MGRIHPRELVDRYVEATFTINRRFNSVLRDSMIDTLTPDQFSTLRYIRDRQQCTSSDLSHFFGVGRSSITAIISRLVAKKFIKRRIDAHDRRVIYLSLTKEGKELFSEIELRIQELLSGYIDHFSEEEATSFIETYEKLAHVLMRHDEK